MGLEERQYSVLVVSAAAKFNEALPAMLPPQQFGGARFASGIGAAKRLLAERPFDFVLVNSPLPDGTGLGFAMDACESADRVVLLFARAEIHDEVYARVVGRGVFTLPKPTSKAAFQQALQWMASARERLRRFEKRAMGMEERMAEIRLVNRAKWLLIQRQGMDEPQAHRFLEKQAMDRCVTKGQVAREILDAAGE